MYRLELCFAEWTCDRFTEDADFSKKKIIFLDEAHFDLGAPIHSKADAPKMSHCLVRILVQRHNWGIFLFETKQGEAVTVNGYRCRAMLNKFLFTKIEEEDIENIWFQQDGSRSYAR